MSFLLRLVVAALTAFAGLMWFNAFLASDPSVSPMVYALLFVAGLVVSLWLAGKARAVKRAQATPEQAKLQREKERAEEIMRKWADQEPE